MRRIISLVERVLPLLFWFTVMLGFDRRYIAVLTVLTAILHELGHLIAYLLVMGKIPLPFATPTGFRIKIVRMLSYKEEAITALGGPLINLFLFLIFSASKTPYLNDFALINLFTCISNLIPIKSYDGYRISFCVLCALLSPQNTEAVLSVVSTVASATLTFISLLLILKLGEGYWIFGIFFASLLGNIFNFHTSTKNEISRELMRF